MVEQGIQPGKLVGALAFLGLAGFAFYGMVFGDADVAVGPDPEILDPALDDAEEELGLIGDEAATNTSAKGQKARVIRADLLAAHGTYEAGLLRNPFRTPVIVPAVAMSADGAAVGSEGWVPPTLVVSMVFRARGVERAAVDGAVVGVGDPLAGGVVRRIERDGIELTLDGTVLFYELQSPYPRGYGPPPGAADEMADEAPDPGGDDPAFADPEEEKE